MMYRHWFWDFDGTLFNTYPRICRALQKSLADAGIFEDEAAIMPYLKQSLETAARHFAPRGPATVEQLLAGYRLHSEEEDLSTMQPFPGMKAFLTQVVRHGGRNYIYTHRGESLFKALKNEQMEPLFTDIVTSLDGFPAKPAPDALLHLLKKHRLNPDECVMVGDRVIDLNAGINAGMHALCVDPDGFFDPGPSIPLFRDYASLSEAVFPGETA